MSGCVDFLFTKIGHFNLFTKIGHFNETIGLNDGQNVVIAMH